MSLIPKRDLTDPDNVLDELVEEGVIGAEAEVEEETVQINTKSKKQTLRVRAEEDENPTKEKSVPETEDAAEDEEMLGEDEGLVDAEPEVAMNSLDGLPDNSDLEMPAPEKPLVTPLTIEIDEEEGIELKEEKKTIVARVVAPKKADVKVRDDDGSDADFEMDPSQKWNVHEGEVFQVPVSEISINPNQPRRKFQEADMDELRNSIDKHGILQPLVVRRLEEHKYELIAGERRLRAATSLDWDKVPCVVRRGAGSGANRIEMALIENIQREDLNSIEVAMAYKQLNEEYGMTHEEIGERVGRSRVNVTNTIRILQLPPEIQKGLIDEKITPGHARAILMIPDQEKQIRFYRHLLEEGLTVRKAETRARRIQRAMDVHDPMRIKRQGRSQYEMKFSGLLEDRFGYDARVKFREELNKFEVMFRCYSQDQIKELLGRLLGELPIEAPDDDDSDEEATSKK